MVGNIGIGIANAIGFKHRRIKGGGGSGNISYPGLIAAWSAKGKSNDDEDRATLRDLTGNGHDITLNGFAFSEMSGYGGYNYTFNTWTNNIATISKNWTFATINGYPLERKVLEKRIGIPSILPYTLKRLKVKIEISGIVNENTEKVKMFFTNGTGNDEFIYINSSGIYTLDEQVFNDAEGNGIYIGFVWEGYVSNPNYKCTIEILPEYPDALVFDGVDDYTSNFLIPENQGTFIYVINAFEDNSFSRISANDNLKSSFASRGGSIIVNWNEDISKSYNIQVSLHNKSIVFVTYDNSKPKITIGSNISYDNLNGEIKTNDNIIESKEYSFGTSKSKNAFAFYSAYLFDRSLDEQEIKSFIRKYIDAEYLLPSEIPTPDCYYDFSKGSNDDKNRDTIVDYSGNGNDAVAHNFAWSGMSGYGGYGTNLLDWAKASQNLTYNVTSNKAIITGENGNFYLTDFRLATSVNAFKFRFKVNLVTTSNIIPLFLQIFNIGNTNETIHILDDIKNDVIYEVDIPALDTDKYTRRNISFDNASGNNTEFTIELLPEYEGALVFDGVDDYISLDAFDSGFKTMFMVCTRDKHDNFLYSQGQNNYMLYIPSPIAYNKYNPNGTYINNVLNTKLNGTSFKLKKHLVMVKTEELENRTPVIGSSIVKNLFANVIIYKFLGFKEALTKEQINAIIKKYNLLDGVDEIEVS